MPEAGVRQSKIGDYRVNEKLVALDVVVLDRVVRQDWRLTPSSREPRFVCGRLSCVARVHVAQRLCSCQPRHICVNDMLGTDCDAVV